ncbi:hypothetical protein YC2023_086043 [Brassica napus]
MDSGRRKLLVKTEIHTNRQQSEVLVMNRKCIWSNGECGVFFVSLYDLRDGEKRLLTFRLNTGACDRISAVTLQREFMRETTVADGCCDEHVAKDVGLGKAIEEMIPSGEGDKLFWAHWMDVLVSWMDAEDPNRRSQVVRMKLEKDQTLKLVAVSVSPYSSNFYSCGSGYRSKLQLRN